MLHIKWPLSSRESEILSIIHVNDQSINVEPRVVPSNGVKASDMERYNSDMVIDQFTESKWISFQM
jgi:acyl-CoA reductase-like NAD-dependent aldehyde dehydrogenase